MSWSSHRQNFMFWALIDKDILTGREVLYTKFWTCNHILSCINMLLKYGIFTLKMLTQTKKNWWTYNQPQTGIFDIKHY